MLRYSLSLQVIMPEWILAIYGAVAYAGSHFGGTRLWQRYGTTLQLYLLAYQVCHSGDISYLFSPSRGEVLESSCLQHHKGVV